MKTTFVRKNKILKRVRYVEEMTGAKKGFIAFDNQPKQAVRDIRLVRYGKNKYLHLIYKYDKEYWKYERESSFWNLRSKRPYVKFYIEVYV